MRTRRSRCCRRIGTGLLFFVLILAGCSGTSTSDEMDVFADVAIDAAVDATPKPGADIVADVPAEVFGAPDLGEADLEPDTQTNDTSLEVAADLFLPDIEELVDALDQDILEVTDVAADLPPDNPVVPLCDPDNPAACNDGDPCTTDRCDPAKGCSYSKVVCDDANRCTRDSCNKNNGACVFAAIVCDDQEDCTTDACSLDTGKCVFTARGDDETCDDHTLCTQDDRCTAGRCGGTETDPDMFASLRNLLLDYLAFSGDPGIGAAVRFSDGCIWALNQGVTTLQEGAPMTPETRFRVGSFTKVNIAILVMMLVEDGLIGLDDAITKYLPDYPQWSAITVRMALGMQSGISDYLLNRDFATDAVGFPDRLDGPDRLLSYVADEELGFVPGTACHYSDTNYVIAGMIIEEATGHSVQYELRTRIFAPLGLDATFLDVDDTVKPNLAHGYMDLEIVAPMLGLEDSIGLFPDDWFLPGEEYLVDSTYALPQMATWAAGAVVSRPADAVQILHALFSGRLLSPGSLVQMQQIDDQCLLLGNLVEYGLGLQTKDLADFGRYWGHGGLQFGYESNTLYLPGLDLAISHMHNYIPSEYNPVQREILARATAGVGAGVGSICPLPGGDFFTGDDDRVALRFKGIINPFDADAKSTLRGTSRIHAMMGGEEIPLYGQRVFAQRVTPTPERIESGSARIEVTSTAPSLTDGVDRRRALLSMDADLLAGQDGVIDLSAVDGMFLIAELTEPDVEDDPWPGCFVAVLDVSRTSRIHLCGGGDFGADVGETLRVYGDVAFTRDETAVTTYLNLYGIERCF